MGMACAFVEVEDRTDGIGKLIDVDATWAEVEYFKSPAGPCLERIRVPVKSVRAVELSPQTRIFWLDSARHAWIAGRVDGGLIRAQALLATEDHYHVRFPNGQEARIPISQLYTRWAHPIEDPTDYLAARITDTPFFFDGRSRIVRHISAQRAAYGGLTGLASAAVELLEHQVTIVRRILADPIERYLLADEVGLGKTIEAGILIRQHVIDQGHEATVLVIVPDHLVAQWNEELATKFFLIPSPEVKVVPETALLGDLLVSASPTMLVVDEAHRTALKAFSPDAGQRRAYEQVRALAIRAPRVLLLSGTPVLHQEDGFLAMLHLLDPDAYQLNDRDSFRRRVLERQAVAEATADLMDDASSFFAQEAIDRLELSFSADARLMQLCSEARQHISEDLQSSARTGALRALRTHLTEIYRLHRRLLRTRRGDPRVQMYLPHRTGMIALQQNDQARREAMEFLEAWRLALAGGETGDIDNRLFALLVAGALSHPRVLLRQMEARLELCRGGKVSSMSAEEIVVLASPWAFDGERQLLEQRRQLIAGNIAQEERAVFLAEWLSSADVRKVIVFVDDADVADLVASTLQGQLDGPIVLRYGRESEGVRIFEESDRLAVLVCDASAEEGLNLQRCGAVIVHYDLPLEPARVEQRIGRVDRIEARGRLRNIVFSAELPYERDWLVCLNKAIRIFDRSVAPLQYALAEATARIRTGLALDGSTAIKDETARLSDSKTGLDSELRRIQAQEAIDAIEINQEGDAAFFESLVERDESITAEGERTLNSWVTDRLQFGRQHLQKNVFRYFHDLRRPTLLPLLDTVARFQGCVDREAFRTWSAGVPLQPVTFDRATAETAHVALLRVGHPFMEALEALIRSDDRGMAFAVWRYMPQWVGIPEVFFRFDFVIEADLTSINPVRELSDTSIQALRRRADEAFPVDYRTVWLTSDLEAARDPHLLAVLRQPYTKFPRFDGGKDLNLRLERWDRAGEIVPFGDWSELCVRARHAAEKMIRSDAEFRIRRDQYAARTRDSAVAIANACASRIARLSGATRESEERVAEMESRLSEALVKGIENPGMRVDSAGVLVLASIPLGNE
jgi:ATP-dependent helicase HepA